MKNKSIAFAFALFATNSVVHASCEQFVKGTFTLEEAKKEAIKNNASKECMTKIANSNACLPTCNTFGNGSLKKCVQEHISEVSSVCKKAAGL